MSKTFISADEKVLRDLITTAERKLFIAVPGLTKLIGEMLAERIRRRMVPEDLTVILDSDPEVCRLGFGDIEGLSAVKAALDEVGKPLHTHKGLRIGLLISDDNTLFFTPTARLIEAGSTSDEKPNAILLKEPPPSELTRAIGRPAMDNLFDEQAAQCELGLDILKDEDLQKTKQDLEEKPPKQFDLARIERVFNYALQFVEFKVKDYQLRNKSVELKANWLGIQNEDLVDRLNNKFKVFQDKKILTVQIKTADQEKPFDYSEKIIEQDAAKLRDYLAPISGYGSLILKAQKGSFQAELAKFERKIEAYAEAVRKDLASETETIRTKLLDDLVPGLVKNPPQEWLKRSVTVALTSQRVRELLSEGLDVAFHQIDKAFDPKVTCVYKDVTYSTIVDDKTFRDALTKQYGAEAIASLFEEFDAAREGKDEDEDDADDDQLAIS